MSEPNQPFWLSWILPVIAVLGIIGAIVKKLFAQAVRAEMSAMHEENRARLVDMGNRVSVMENTLARIEGRMQERWGNYQEDER
jgi:hypothetical protein